MSGQIRVMTPDDIGNDADLVRFFEQGRKLHNFLGYQHALASASVRAMLREVDRQRKDAPHRAASVARPLAFASGLQVASARLFVISATRFRLQYADEIAAARRPRRARRQFTFGDDG